MTVRELLAYGALTAGIVLLFFGLLVLGLYFGPSI